MEVEESKWRQIAKSPIVWGGLGVLTGAISSPFTFRYLFCLGCLVVCVGLIEINLFEGRRLWVLLLGNLVVLSALTFGFSRLWRIVPHPAELPSLDQQLDAFARRFPLLNSRTDSPTPNKKEDAVVRTEPPVSSSKAVVPAHLHITNVAIEPIKESNVSVKLSYIDDGGEDARLAHRYGIAIRETPLSFPARKELEDSMFKPLVSEVLHSPQTQITSNQLLEDTLAVTFPSAQLLDEYKTGKKNLYILGRFRYKGSKGWNHSDYCYYVGFSEKHVTLCAAHNEEPRM